MGTVGSRPGRRSISGRSTRACPTAWSTGPRRCGARSASSSGPGPASSRWGPQAGGDGIKAAVRAGVRSIEHGIYLDDEAIGLMLDRGAWLVPTLVAPRGVLAAAAAGVAIPETSRGKAAEVAEIHADSFRRALAATT